MSFRVREEKGSYRRGKKLKLSRQQKAREIELRLVKNKSNIAFSSMCGICKYIKDNGHVVPLASPLKMLLKFPSFIQYREWGGAACNLYFDLSLCCKKNKNNFMSLMRYVTMVTLRCPFHNYIMINILKRTD